MDNSGECILISTLASRVISVPSWFVRKQEVGPRERFEGITITPTHRILQRFAMAVKNTVSLSIPPSPPLTHWWSPPSHDGLLDTDVEESVRNVPMEHLDEILWKTHQFYKAMLTYIRTCLACRASAQRMGLPHGTKQDWWDFVYDADNYLSRIESRMMFVLEEMARRHQPKKKKNKSKSKTPPSSPSSLRPLKKRRVADE